MIDMAEVIIERATNGITAHSPLLTLTLLEAEPCPFLNVPYLALNIVSALVILATAWALMARLGAYGATHGDISKAAGSMDILLST
jgi:hypothetical protein